MLKSACDLLQQILLLLAAFGLTGCGYGTYLTRLNETRQYFAYEDQKNQNLDREWKSKENAVSLRPPKQFKEIKAPPPVPDDEGNLVPAPLEDDPRQPKYLNAFLPGLIGAWETEKPLTVVVGRSQRQAPGYMYVLSNWDLWKSSDTDDEAGVFHTEVTELLGSFAEDERWKDEDEWDVERRPSGNGFVEQKAYTHFTFEFPELIDQLPTEVRYYIYAAGDHQIAIVFVLPKGYGSGEQLPERINLCLETVKAKGQTPGRVQGTVEGRF